MVPEEGVCEQRDVEREAFREHHEAEVDPAQVGRRGDAVDLILARHRNHLLEGLLPGVHFDDLTIENYIFIVHAKLYLHIVPSKIKLPQILPHSPVPIMTVVSLTVVSLRMQRHGEKNF